MAQHVGQQLAEQVDERGIAPDSMWDSLQRFSLNKDVCGAFVGALGSRQTAVLIANRGLSLNGDDVDEESEEELPGWSSWGM